MWLILFQSGKPSCCFIRPRTGHMRIEVHCDGELVWISLGQATELLKLNGSPAEARTLGHDL